MDLEEIFGSLKSLSDIADYYILDTSVCGFSILPRGQELCLKIDLARQNKVKSITLKNALYATETFMEFLKDCKNIGTTRIVIKELDSRIKALEYFNKAYDSIKRNCRSTNGFEKTSPIEKEKTMLKSIVAGEYEITRLLKFRTNQGLIPDSLRYIEDIVITANKRTRNLKNLNDERIIGESIYNAFLNDTSVAVITRDNRFEEILSRTQSLLSRNLAYKELFDFLQNGKLSIILGEERFSLIYNSGDFK